MRIFRAAVLAFVAVAAVGCGSGGRLFRQYEYEEDVYLSLDGTATVYVNTSIAALDALRGAAFNANPRVRIDRDGVRSFYTTPFTRVTAINESRRSGRRFVHVRLDVEDIRRLGETGPFAWSSYDFRREADLYAYRQSIGAGPAKDVGDVGWSGREFVAFRLHLPSKITYHNIAADFRRGNILVLEQPLSERLKGVPLTLDANMQTQSILYSALALFGATGLAVALMFAVVIVWVRRSGTRGAGQASGAG